MLLVNGAEGNYFQRLRTGRGGGTSCLADAIRRTVEMVWDAHDFRRREFFQRGAGAGQHARERFRRYARIDAGPADDVHGEPRAFTWRTRWPGGFVQDSWSLNAHVVAQAGVRADWDRLFQSALVQPRGGAELDAVGRRRAKFSIGWGMYDIPLNLSVIGQTKDQQEVDTLYDPTGTIVLRGRRRAGLCCRRAACKVCSSRISILRARGGSSGLEKTRWCRVELLARDQHHGLVYETVSPGQIGADFLLQSSRRDKYRGATVTARHTFKNTAVLFGSYTRSKASSGSGAGPDAGGALFCGAAAGGAELGRAEPVFGLGERADADLGDFVYVLVRLPHRVSVQFDQPAAIFGGGGEFAAVSGLCELDDSIGEEVSVSEQDCLRCACR